MKEMPRGVIAATKWKDLAIQLPIAVTNDGEIVAYLVKGKEDVIDISYFHPVMKQKVLSIKGLVDAGR